MGIWPYLLRRCGFFPKLYQGTLYGLGAVLTIPVPYPSSTQDYIPYLRGNEDSREQIRFIIKDEIFELN